MSGICIRCGKLMLNEQEGADQICPICIDERSKKTKKNGRISHKDLEKVSGSEAHAVVG